MGLFRVLQGSCISQDLHHSPLLLLLPPVPQIERPLCSSLEVSSNRLFICFSPAAQQWTAFPSLACVFWRSTLCTMGRLDFMATEITQSQRAGEVRRTDILSYSRNEKPCSVRRKGNSYQCDETRNQGTLTLTSY